MGETEAAERAMGLAIERPTLGTFFKKQKGDVVAMLLTEFNQELYDANRREEGREEGKREIACGLVADGILTPEMGAERLGVGLEEFQEMLSAFAKA